jgi:pentatricopeptide repeat protein
MNIVIDSSTYALLLQGCVKTKSLQDGKTVHAHMIIQAGIETQDVSIGNNLVTMYAKCGIMTDAHIVFEKMPNRDVVSWTAMIAGYARWGNSQEALALFNQMLMTGIKANQFTFASILPACTNLVVIETGKKIHEKIIRMGFESDVFVGSALVDMYAKCGSMEDAHRMFDKMPQRDIVSWNALIAGYVQNRDSDEALGLFYRMRQVGVQPDQFSFASVLPACGNLALLEEVHEEIKKRGFQSNAFVGSALIDMYARNGRLQVAREVFDEMLECNVISWNAMISGYAQNGHLDEAMKLFEQMPKRDVVSWNAMVAGYAQHGLVDEAIQLFRKMPETNALSWNAVISGYVKHGQDEAALMLFYEMLSTDIQPNQFIFSSVLPACANLAALEHGKRIHDQIARREFQSDVFIGSALVDMYAKCKSLEIARDVFDKMPQKDVVTWTAMTAGYAQNGQCEEALALFREMQLAGVKPDAETFATVLPVCANLAALEQGREFHGLVIRSGLQSNVFVGSALVDMYAKCGSIETARSVFDTITQRGVVSWNVMIVGYAMHGCAMEALQMFHQMQQSGTNPDHVTLVGVLSACCHAGLVDKGRQFLTDMNQYYQITPTMEHYSCMVDLLGRAGQFVEALDFIDKMPISPNATVWKCLLGACRKHINIELGELAAERLFELEPENTAPYVLLSNIYAAAGKWDEIEKVRKMMKDRGLIKKPGCSWIQVNKQVCAFLVGDRSHPQTEGIYAELERLAGKMKAAGYVPDTGFVLNDVEEEQKEQILCYHSEKLAVAFGLINTSPGTTIRIIKNLRVCGDCHSAIKFISKILVRVFVVRDSYRFHNFRDGQCSCQDYW